MSSVDACDTRIAEAIFMLLSARDPVASICPSEVARRLWPDDGWRDAMPEVRRVACELARGGRIVITQADRVLDPDVAPAGPVRLRRGPHWQAAH